MTVTESIEKIKEKMCDDYCKYRNMPIPEGKEEDWMLTDEESPCFNCPLNEL